MIDCPGNQDGSSLRSLIDKPPVCGNSFSPLTGALLTGFRLHTGPVLALHNMHMIAVFISSCTLRQSCSVSPLIFFISFCFTAARTVQADAHTASKEEKQTQAQAPSTAGSTASRYSKKTTFLLRRECSIFWTDLNVFLFWPCRNSIRLWSKEEEEKARRWPRPQEKEERQEKEESKQTFFFTDKITDT